MTHLQKHDRPDFEAIDPWAGDTLERQSIAAYLTPVIASITQPFVISLHSPFGTGKTHFIKRWQQDLINQEYRAIYFNAWETDFSEDALLAFMGTVKRQLEDTAEDVAQAWLPELARKAGGFLGRKALPVLARGVIRKALGEKTLDEVLALSDENEEDIAKLAGAVVEEGLKSQVEGQKSVEAFRDYLAEMVSELTKDQDDPAKRKLIVFVDELDRCRPTYAVQVLERIKHLFSADGLVFVLAIDDDQLRNAVSAVYGTNLDADGYLRRFIDWRFTLPEPPARAFAQFLCERFKLAETGKFDGRNGFHDLAALAHEFGIFSEALGLSLRQQEQCFTDVNLASRSLSERAVPLANVLGCLAVLRTAYPIQYRACCLGEEDVETFLDELEPSLTKPSLGELHRTWEEFRRTFHFWFLSEAGALQLIEEKTKSEEILKTHEHSDENANKLIEIAQRINYLNDVIDYFRSGDYVRRGKNTSLASIVFKRLEGAAHFSQR